jgi:hypothetical protein
MPPRLYLWAHPRAQLPEQERQELLRGLEATFGTNQHRARHDTSTDR